ncbi:MAG TPA: hypothetical protein VNN73_17440 [Blastocatellia bacterium]|nr:hypothetical protein [Blastocatellia bacterium]
MAEVSGAKPHRFKEGDRAIHPQLGEVVVKRLLPGGGVVLMHMDFGEFASPVSMLTPAERQNDALDDLTDVAGTLAALIDSGEVIGVVVVTVNRDESVASITGGDLLDCRAVIAEMEILKAGLIRSAAEYGG